jgi:hypothetical protein
MSDWVFDHLGSSAFPKEMDDSHVSPHGQEYLLTDDGQLSVVSAAKGGAHGPPGGGGGTGTGSPASTLVGSSAGLQINLIWDDSVRTAANWSDVETAVTAAAQIYTSAFATHAVLNIQVGLGEVDGSKLGPGALGESDTLGYAVGYSTLTNALGVADAGLVSAGLMTAGAAADAALAAKTFFVAAAEAKALGLVNATSAAVDGYIGLTSSSALAFTGAPGANQYDAVGVAAHELSEVMGRIGIEGTGSGDYTPLDLFRYSAAHQPDTTPTAGYFSTDLGATVLNSYNNPANGGDASDWATLPANTTDAYDAFDNPGVTTGLTKTDLLEVAVLGYKLAGTLGPVTA